MCMHEMKLSQYRLLLHCYIPNYLSSANLYVVNIFGEGGKDGHPKIKILCRSEMTGGWLSALRSSEHSFTLYQAKFLWNT